MLCIIKKVVLIIFVFIAFIFHCPIHS